MVIREGEKPLESTIVDVVMATNKRLQRIV